MYLGGGEWSNLANRRLWYAVTAAATGRPAEHDRVGGGFILWEESLGTDTRGEGLQEILYQAYGLRGFSRFANLLAIAHLRICESLAPKKNKNRKFANAQLAIVEIWDTLIGGIVLLTVECRLMNSVKNVFTRVVSLCYQQFFLELYPICLL
jgi:hypothetical protein